MGASLAASGLADIALFEGRFNEAASIRARGIAADLAAANRDRAATKSNAALKNKQPKQAVTLLTEANTLLDTWMAHFDLGRAHLDDGAFLAADSELDGCLRRRGEGLSVLLDEEFSYGYLPPVYYYQGRVREALKTDAFAESYRAYLGIREQAGEDPLVAEVRRRAGR